jgi:putative MATE family efflux protein
MTRLMTRDRAFYRNFFSLTVMVALQNLITCAVGLADNVMIGAYSEQALSGVALANQIQFLLQMFTMGVGEGIVVLSAQYWGKKETDPIRDILSIGLKIGMIGTILLWAAVFFFPEAVLGLFTQDQGVIAQGAEYIRIVCFSYFFFCVTTITLCALRSVETVKIGILVSVISFFVNVFLNYLLIFGKFGFPQMGARGAAVATLIARIVECLIVVIYAFVFDRKIRFHWKALFHFNWQLFRDYLRVGLFVLMSNTIWGLAMGIQAAILGHMGSNAIAANSIAATIFQVISVVLYGAGSAAAVITGRTVGEDRIQEVKEYAKTMQILFLLIGILTGIGLFAIKGMILSFYDISGATRELADQFINVLCITGVGTAYQCACLTGIVRGGGDTRFVFINDFIFMWLIVLPLSALAAFVWNLSPLWVFIFLKSDQIAKCFVAFPKVNRFRWIRQLTR